MYELTIFDFLAALLWITIIGIYSYFHVHFKIKKKPQYKYYLYGLYAKIFGGICFGFIYAFYYEYTGDTFTYYRDIQKLTTFFYSEPINVIKTIFQEVDTFNPDTYHITSQIFFFRGADTFMVVRVCTIINFLGFNTYLGTTVILSYLSFLGIWKLFLLFESYYPEIRYKLAIAILYFPSVIFWGSGILKDSIVIGCMGFMLYYLNELILKGRISIVSWAILLSAIFITSQTKAYVIISLLPATALWIVPSMRKKIKNKAIKIFIAPVLIISSFFIAFLMINYFSSVFERFSIDNALDTAKVYQDWHYIDGDTERSGRGSSYTLGDYSPTIMSMISMIPAGINVALFRPYIWEIRNAVMAMAAFESLFVLILTLTTIIKTGIIQLLKTIISNPFIQMCVIFSLFFAFAVGFSSYNFGALVRYKIPCIPIYISALFILLHIKEKEKDKFIATNKTPFQK